MGAPRWQEPLAVRADRAEQTLRDVVRAPAGGSGPARAAAAAKRDLAELCREFAERTTSPLLKQLLVNGGHALTVEAGFLDDLAAVDEALDDIAVPVAPAESEPAPEPVETSDDAQANELVDPLAHVRVGDPDPLAPDGDWLVCGAQGPSVFDLAGTGLRNSCDREQGHPPQWRHIALDLEEVVEVWHGDHRGKTDEPPVRGAAATKEPAHVRADASLNEVADLVEQVRSDAQGWLLRDNSIDPWARQSAIDGMAGIDRCVSLLHRLRAELVTGLARADAAGAAPAGGG